MLGLGKNFLIQGPEMCGRFVLMTPGSNLAERFKLEEVPLDARYNIAPTQKVAIISESRDASEAFSPSKWGHFRL